MGVNFSHKEAQKEDAKRHKNLFVLFVIKR